MHRKKEKAYWEKRTERFQDGSGARSRAGHLRNHAHVSHVQLDKDGSEYVVSFSVARWYLVEMQKAGIKL